RRRRRRRRRGNRRIVGPRGAGAGGATAAAGELGAERVGADQLGGPLGLLPPEEVPDALEDLQLGGGDQRGDQLAVGDRDHLVLGAVDDQGRRGDLGQARLGVVAADRLDLHLHGLLAGGQR